MLNTFRERENDIIKEYTTNPRRRTKNTKDKEKKIRI